MQHELGIIGAGNMAEAIARSVIAAGVIRKEGIVAADISPCGGGVRQADWREGGREK